jgi:hypothetical protein
MEPDVAELQFTLMDDKIADILNFQISENITGRCWKEEWCPEPELNQRHADFQSVRAVLIQLGNFKSSRYDSTHW